MTGTLEGVLLAGRYRIGAVIGRGGMSIVYEAEDLRLSRRVAIKVLDGDESSVAAERLFREAKAAARAEHPAVVMVFEYGSDDSCGLDYLVMERLQGEDLATRIQRVGRLGPKLVLALGVEIADALAHLHERGILHRDLKPANVFLARRGLRTDEIKLLDFGVAKQLDMQTLTAPGQILGTLLYMAPEQLGDPKAVDARSDIFALGVTLYECLTASLPYAAGTVVDIARQIASGTRTPLQTKQPDLPEALCAVVERCMMLRPKERFASARNVCSALLAAQSQP